MPEEPSLIHCGDVLDVLRTLPGESIDCCITSPPYWGLRDYGCVGQIGLEETPALYVAKMVEVFTEVRRVLRDDGTLWLNLGDSYHNGDNGGYAKDRITATDSMQRSNLGANFIGAPNRQPQLGLKPKDLVGLPWRVAFALQADGWWLRSDIIWHKPNPMPESVTDRPTKSHEYIFLLAKSERYYYDYEAIKERSAWPDGPNSPESIASPYGQGFTRANEPESFKGSKFNTGKTATHQLNRSSDKQRVHGNLPGRSDGGAACNKPGQEYRNIRSVWTQATCPFPEAHFATFPPKLIEPCVIAGCPAGGTILDPFAGAGTTGLVAKKHGRRFIGIELNPAYVAMAEKRLSQEVLPFSEATA